MASGALLCLPLLTQGTDRDYRGRALKDKTLRRVSPEAGLSEGPRAQGWTPDLQTLPAATLPALKAAQALGSLNDLPLLPARLVALQLQPQLLQLKPAVGPASWQLAAAQMSVLLE